VPAAAVARCAARDLARLEAALSSQDPVVVSRALVARVAAARGGKALLPAGCRLVVDRKTLSTTAGGVVVEATVLGPARSRWRLHLHGEAGGWKVARMERLTPAGAEAAELSKSA
jgi:hypothetical protein